MKYEIYLSKTDTLLNVTLKDAMDYINVPSAAIVTQNDTIIFEHYIGLDSKKYHVAKSFAGLTTNVRDLARIGRLFLNNGNIDGLLCTALLHHTRSRNSRKGKRTLLIFMVMGIVRQLL